MEAVHEAAERNDVNELGRPLDEDPGLIEAGEPKTALYRACKAGSVDAARLLLDRGADGNERDEEMWTPLMWACCNGHVEVVKLLLERAVDPSLRTSWGSTALMLASWGHVNPDSDHVAVIRLLIKDGRVPVDARDKYGYTALYNACARGNVTRARVLLIEGHAKYSLGNDKGTFKTPRDAADAHGHDNCLQLLWWYEGELRKAYLLSKARAVVDAAMSIDTAAQKAQVMTEAEAQEAREEAAPDCLWLRVALGKPLPEVEVTVQAMNGEVEAREEERAAVCECVVRWLPKELFTELMQGLRYQDCGPV